MRIYDRPEYYDIAFSFRDIKKEVDFLEAVIKKYSRIRVRSVLELAAGNAPYLAELSKRGYYYSGLDSNATMIRYARRKAKMLRTKPGFIKGDLKRFSRARKVELVFLLLGSLYVKSDQELLEHLRSVSQALRKGGLYLLDGAVGFFPGDIRKQSWTMQRNGIVVKTMYDPQAIDVKNDLYEERIAIEVTANGKKVKWEQRMVKKIYTIQHFLKIVAKEGALKMAGAFADFSMHKKPRRRRRNILVLRKK